MRADRKASDKALTSDKLGKLQGFVEKLKDGKAAPFKEKTEQAKKDLKKIGLIK